MLYWINRLSIEYIACVYEIVDRLPEWTCENISSLDKTMLSISPTSPWKKSTQILNKSHTNWDLKKEFRKNIYTV